MKYNVFISYRREGGYETAKHLNDLLVRDGYKVSFDIDTLRNGDFDVQLLERIEQCKDFILIIDPNAFDRTLDPTFDRNKDWLRIELAHALKHKKNIIPVFLAGITGFPEGLPEDVAGVVTKNGPEFNKYYFDDFYKKLKSRFLKSRSIKKLIFGGLLSILLITGVVFLLLGNREHNDVVYIDPMVPRTTDEVEFKAYARERLDEVVDSLGFQNQDEAIAFWFDQNDCGNDLNIGLYYIVGEDFKKAVKYLSNAAENGDAVAQYLIGVCYDNGIGISQDLERAKYWYKEAAENGVPEAQCDYGIACTTENNMHEAEKWLLQSAEQGYSKAEYTLGWNYGANYNVDKALLWMEKAAKHDYVKAQLSMCSMYLQGPPAIQDFDEAVKILEDLVKQDNPIAQYALALCFAQNKGVDVDFEKAMDYLKKSAEQGYAQALVDLGSVYCSGNPALNIPQDYTMALDLFRRAAEQGYPMAQIYMGRMYENGWEVEKSKKKAEEWYKKAERQGLTLQLIQQQQQQQFQQQYQYY